LIVDCADIYYYLLRCRVFGDFPSFPNMLVTIFREGS
jgi:hypothetical protein